MNFPAEPSPAALAAGDAFARRIARRLTEGSDELPYDISERLRAARMQALARRKRVSAVVARPAASGAVLHAGGGTAALGGAGQPTGGGWWRALASAVPVLALLIGVFAINMVQDEKLAQEMAQVDTALLADTLPPSAYADPGFAQYLRTSGTTP